MYGSCRVPCHYLDDYGTYTIEAVISVPETVPSPILGNVFPFYVSVDFLLSGIISSGTPSIKIPLPLVTSIPGINIFRLFYGGA
jgi:hypothetical protein